jgi:non-ribosomal peptide synthetase-like protein
VLLSTFGLLGTLAAFRLASVLPALVLAAVLPGVYLGSALLLYFVVAGLKWLVVGRYRPRVAPMWSHFVWRSELITALYESAAVPGMLGAFTGTPFLGPLLRLLGARIGRRVYLETTYLTEFDLVRVGDDAMIGGTTSLQTHLFEDRVMKMSTVTVGPACTVGPRSVVLYDSQLEVGAGLDALSLVMKGERLPAETGWRGIPARLVD